MLRFHTSFSCFRQPGPLLLISLLFLAAPVAADTFVGSGGKILSFFNFDSGNAEPRREIGGALTGLSDVLTLALDPVHREIWVTDVNLDEVLVFDMDADGNVPPLRRIDAAALEAPRGLMLDLARDEIHVVDFLADAVFVFPRTQNGSTAPVRTLTGNLTGLDGPVLGFLDLVNDELYVSVFAGGTARIAVFDRATADGNIAPIRTLEGGASGINNPRAVVIDLPTDRMIVSEYDFDRLRVYNRLASGGTAFLHEIAGAQTALDAPFQVVLTTFGELVIGTDTAATPRVVVHEATASGNVLPERLLVGGATGLDVPTGVASDFARNCSWGNSVDGCIFRDSFESNELCYWSSVQGGAACL